MAEGVKLFQKKKLTDFRSPTFYPSAVTIVFSQLCRGRIKEIVEGRKRNVTLHQPILSPCLNQGHVCEAVHDHVSGPAHVYAEPTLGGMSESVVRPAPGSLYPVLDEPAVEHASGSLYPVLNHMPEPVVEHAPEVIYANHSDHWIHLEQPQVVIKAIHRVVARAQGTTNNSRANKPTNKHTIK